MTDPEINNVAKDLREIVDLSAALEDQAVAKADHHLMPGGEAMVMLAPVADPEARENVIDGRERWNDDHDDEPGRIRDTSHINDEDEGWEPPLQTLLFWSEAWRVEHGAVSDLRPTIASEAGFLRGLLQWVYDTEPRWDDFAKDVRTARVRLENTLYAGERDETGAPCLYCRTLLVRARQQNGGLADDYDCPTCKRHYTNDEYHQAVKAAALRNAEWLSMPQLVERCEAKAGTVRVWANRGEVKKRRDHETGRTVYRVRDVLRMLGDDEEMTA